MNTYPVNPIGAVSKVVNKSALQIKEHMIQLRNEKRESPPVFKEYTMGQIVLLPTNLDEAIPANHLVRVVNEYVDKMDMGPILRRYKGGGTSSYHPRMMLKILVYAYIQNIYSSRRIAKAMRENIPFMWLSGLNKPDFHTINRFRGVVLKGIIEEVFFSLIKLLIEEGYVRYEDIFVDGTKVEANANRYTAVWAKNTERYEKMLSESVTELLKEIEQINKVEQDRYGDKDLEELGGEGPLSAEHLAQSIETLNEQLNQSQETPLEESMTVENPPVEDSSLVKTIEAQLSKLEPLLAAQPKNRALRKAARILKKDCLVGARKYATQRQLLGGRNSYSKTDTQATFLRLKEDQKNPTARPRPAYNIQNATENQFVVNFSIHQEAADSTCFIPHMKQLKTGIGRLPKNANGDSTYGNEENYAYLAQEKVGNYLKFKGFDRQQKPRYQPDPFQAENMPYDEKNDTFTCPAGKLLTLQFVKDRESSTGFIGEIRRYECDHCSNCDLKEKCTKSVNKHTVTVNLQFWKYRAEANANLLSEKGVRLRKQRGPDVEGVFGRIKQDWGFRKFNLRGIEKVSVEWGLLCLGHNMMKVWTGNNEGKLVSL